MKPLRNCATKEHEPRKWFVKFQGRLRKRTFQKGDVSLRREWSSFKWQKNDHDGTVTSGDDVDDARNNYKSTMIKETALAYLDQGVSKEFYEVMEPFSEQENPPLPYPSYKMKGSQ